MIIVILVISVCAIFVMIIKSMLNPIKGSGEFIQLTRLESETNQSKKIFSTIITIIIITIKIIVIMIIFIIIITIQIITIIIMSIMLFPYFWCEYD